MQIREGETLVVFDEIKEAPRGIAALKYFCEDAPLIHVAAAGSLLGITLHEGTSFPVGVKAAENLNSKSLRTFVSAHDGLKGVRFSLSPHRDQGWMRNVPLYAAGVFFRT